MSETATGVNAPSTDTSLAAFLARQYPPADPLVIGLLNRREFAVLIGRRRHGKTTVLMDLAFRLGEGETDFIGYLVPKQFRVLAFLLEDDPGELQEKLRAMLGDKPPSPNVYIVAKDDFYSRGIPINVMDQRFKDYVLTEGQRVKPDAILFDNFAQLVRADYNDPKKVDHLVLFVYKLHHKFNAAVVMAAHPRKRGSEEFKASLKSDPEDFFEECMGSSHLINCAGTLWGIEREGGKERTFFVGGTQRRDGSQALTPLEMVDGWFVVSDDWQERLDAVLTTDKRRSAWNALPCDRAFSRAEAESLLKPFLKHSSFIGWWKELERKGLVISEGSQYRRNAGLANVSVIGTLE